jgi:ATP phosphoribosyltransferase regulatory subunit
MTGNWLLPENLADVLPAEALQIESLRRRMLDLFRGRGFELVLPPLVEYLESLLPTAGQDLRLRTFKLVDQLSGRTLGVRADMTSQVTRIDAHILNRPGVVRLCYCGPVLHARPAGLMANRELLQIGAEIYGQPSLEADLDIIRLALDCLNMADVEQPALVLCHAGLVRAIIESDLKAVARADEIVTLLRDKDLPGLADLRLGPNAIDALTVTALEVLPKSYGDLHALAKAKHALPKLPGVTLAIEELESLFKSLSYTHVSIDLSDVGAYGYHSGVTFSIYAEGWHDALVQGGRYDNVSQSFGRPRSATGFSLDLRKIARDLWHSEKPKAICAPHDPSPDLQKLVTDLRESGEIVVQLFSKENPPHDAFLFDRHIVQVDRQWVVQNTPLHKTVDI